MRKRELEERIYKLEQRVKELELRPRVYQPFGVPPPCPCPLPPNRWPVEPLITWGEPYPSTTTPVQWVYTVSYVP